MKYSWILFDADDTIFDFNRSAKASFLKTLSDFGIESREDYYLLYKQLNEATWLAFERNEITAEELRRIRFEKFLNAIEINQDPLKVNAHYLSVLAANPMLIEGALELLLLLRKNQVKLGLITNGLKEVQRKRIKYAALERLFDVIVVSDEIGVSKPDEGFFAHAFHEMEHPPKKTVLVVGDSLLSDIKGGENFGLDTCWYNPGRKQNTTTHIPTYEVAQLEEIPSLVQI
jgi:putative hydrolase of the HAD superfamily